MGKNLNLSEKLDFNVTDLTAPDRVIEEILSELPKETNGIILGKIEAYNGPVFSCTTFQLSELTNGNLAEALGGKTVDIQKDLGEIGQEEYKYECFLYTPEYDKYKYRVFFVNYSISNYPVDIILEESVAESISDSGAYVYKCGTREELESLIFRIFSSKRVISVMQNLIWINQAKKSAKNMQV